MSDPDVEAELDELHPPPPPGLSTEAAALWSDWHAELAEDDTEPDARERAVLAEACRHLTLAGRLERALGQVDDVVVPGSRGNMRVTPLVSEVDKVRRSVAAMLASIKAPIDRSAVNSRNGAARWRR